MSRKWGGRSIAKLSRTPTRSDLFFMTMSLEGHWRDSDERQADKKE